jgi:hypothetical protein
MGEKHHGPFQLSFNSAFWSLTVTAGLAALILLDVIEYFSVLRTSFPCRAAVP